ncbi:hypothetical protein E4U55_001615 [Claviceps digitariae]|nr:hypothetical protein E4U55_001615 [Claviceps digitariae]
MATVVVKLGGAALTDKANPDTLSASLDTLADNIARVYQTQLRPHGKRLVLIHGAGSFGHPPAKKFQVKTGWLTPTTTSPTTTGTAANEHENSNNNNNNNVDDDTEHEQKRNPTHRRQQKPQQEKDGVKFGMALTRQRLLQLHHHMLQRLHDRAQLPVLSVSTYDTVETSAGQLTADSSTRLVSRVQNLLAQGFIPLLSGDAVFDLAWGSTILSGDTLMHTLATALPDVHRCVFVTDVAGIYTRDPKRFDDAALIRELRCSSEPDIFDQDDDVSACAAVDDVTGSMGNKWQWVRRIMTDAPHVRSVIICQASEANRAVAMAGDGGDDRSGDAHRWTSIVR